MNYLDKMISYVSPAQARRRMQNRVMMEHMKGWGKNSRRRFEAASKGRRTDGWVTHSGTVNELMQSGLKTLIDRSRYLTVNNSYAKRGVKAIASHTVGAGILPQVIQGPKKFETLLRDWADSLEVDADGRHDLYGIEYLVMKTVVESGSCLIRKRFRPASFGLAVPLQIQILESDYLDTSKGIMGIEFDRYGRRKSYWLYEQNPSDPSNRLRMLKSIEVPASDIIHVFETHRPGQVTGFPWLSPSILRINDLDDYESAQLVRQKIAACLVGVLTDKDGAAEEDDDRFDDFEMLEPGEWKIAPPGTTVEFSNPPIVQGYGEYVAHQLHSISAGLEVPYIILANDYSRVNYSSARMAFMEFYRSIEHWRWHMLVPQFCGPVFKWFVDAAVLSGKARGNPRATWVPPKREFIDPKTEIEAHVMETRAAFSSISEQVRSRGYDPNQVFNEIAEDNKKLDELGIISSADGRQDIKAKPSVGKKQKEEQNAT